jgi:hypothetical protein
MEFLSFALFVTLASPFPTRGWATSTPEAEGLDSSVLEAFHQEPASGKHGYVDGMLVMAFTGWNIYDGPALGAHLALSRVTASVR